MGAFGVVQKKNTGVGGGKVAAYTGIPFLG